MKLINRITLALALLLVSVPGYGNQRRTDMTGERRQQLIDSLENQIKISTGPRERLRLIYDIYDLSLPKDRANNADRLYQAASAARDTAAMLDALRNRALRWNYNDSAQEIIQKTAEMMPSSPSQRETVTFIRLARARTAARTLKDSIRSEKLHQLVMGFSNDSQVDVYRRIELVGILITFLSDGVAGQLLFDYLNDMDHILQTLPDTGSGSLRSLFYTTAGNSATLGMRHKEAIEYLEKRLKIIDKLEEDHHKNGRKYRNYDTDRYLVYRLMLMNYPALTSKEVEYYHNKVLELAEQNAEVDKERSDKQISTGFYLLSQGQYAPAVAHFMTAAQKCKNNYKEPMILKGLIEAAQKAGDKDALIYAYSRYIHIHDQHDAAMESDRFLEQQVMHDVNELRSANVSLASDIHNTELDKRNTIITISAISIGALFVLLVCLFISLAKARKLAKVQSRLNKQLTEERETMRQTETMLIAARDKAQKAEKRSSEFITIFSHEISEPVNALIGYSQLIVDSVDGKRRAIMDRFIKIIELNGELLKTLVNDVLDASEIENSQVVLKYYTMGMNDMIHYATESLSAKPRPGVALDVRPMAGTDPNAVIETDSVRCGQVLINLIGNAVKFTEKGTITVEYGVDKDSNMAQFVVTDTGPGIPPDKADIIFNRFEKLSKITRGIGLGLNIARKVARILGGDVVLDTGYTHGARFVFTLPLKINEEQRQFGNMDE